MATSISTDMQITVGSQIQGEWDEMKQEWKKGEKRAEGGNREGEEREREGKEGEGRGGEEKGGRRAE